MRMPKVVEAGDGGVPRAVFGESTARMKAEALNGLKARAADDGVPCEMIGGETMRLDQNAIDGLLEKSEGVAIGTPKRGLPQLPEEVDIEIVETRASVETDVVAAPIEDAIVAAPVHREPSMPIYHQTHRLRDLLIGGSLALVVIAAWYCATQL